MFNKKDFAIESPQPVKCFCGKGWLVPILRPVTIKVEAFNTPKYTAWGDKCQIFWQCTGCEKMTVGE